MFARTLPSALLAALALAACANHSSNGTTASAPSQTSVKPVQHTANETCRMIRDDAPGRGRNVLYRCDGRAVLNSAEGRAVLAGGAKIEFGGSGAVLNRKGLISRQAANRVGKSDSETCERAYLNAAKKFQGTAAQYGGNRVIRFHSFYNRKPLHGGQYECEVGTFHGRVVMKGDISK